MLGWQGTQGGRAAGKSEAGIRQKSGKAYELSKSSWREHPRCDEDQRQQQEAELFAVRVRRTLGRHGPPLLRITGTANFDARDQNGEQTTAHEARSGLEFNGEGVNALTTDYL